MQAQKYSKARSGDLLVQGVPLGLRMLSSHIGITLVSSMAGYSCREYTEYGTRKKPLLLSSHYYDIQGQYYHLDKSCFSNGCDSASRTRVTQNLPAAVNL